MGSVNQLKPFEKSIENYGEMNLNCWEELFLVFSLSLLDNYYLSQKHLTIISRNYYRTFAPTVKNQKDSFCPLLRKTTIRFKNCSK